MSSVQRWPVFFLLWVAVVLIGADTAVRLPGVGWLLGVSTGCAIAGALSLGLHRCGTQRFGAANLVTAARAGLVAGVAGLIPDPGSRGLLVVLASVALSLDLVDGWLARRTDQVSALGARFDMEVDALLILLLSVVATATYDAGWVLLIGAARYLLWAAQLALPWLRAATPARRWAKIVAATQGVLLAGASAGLVPRSIALPMLAVALLLLAESFWWQVRWLRSHRDVRAGDSGGLRSIPATAIAVLLLWLALTAPDLDTGLTAWAFFRIPLEAIVLLALLLVSPSRWTRSGWPMRVITAVLGVLITSVLTLKLLDAAFDYNFARPFDPLSDWYYLGPGFGILTDLIGRWRAEVVVLVLMLFLALVAGTLTWALRRLADAGRRSPKLARYAVVILTIGWLVSTLTGATVGDRVPLASKSSVDEAAAKVSVVRANLEDRRHFARALAHDSSAQPRLRGLAGRDVLLVFVESYGRVAVRDPELAGIVRPALRADTERLNAAGYQQRTGFLTSPTFGAGSWLAHSSVQSGLWVNSQERYNQLLTRKRRTLTSVFSANGWRTVFDVPSITRPWPEGKRFYGFDTLYDAGNVGYRGPKFGYARVPDQYTLGEFADRELAPGPRTPVMAEIDLVSSHHPWTPLPRMLPWSELGDGSRYHSMTRQSQTSARSLGESATVKRGYARSIRYSWQSLTEFLERSDDPNLVVIVLGDHQPNTTISGTHAGHDVPISLISRDPGVFSATAGWGWQPGLDPGPESPVWRMDAFRDRFLAAFD